MFPQLRRTDAFLDVGQVGIRKLHLQSRQRFGKPPPRTRADHRNDALPFGKHPGESVATIHAALDAGVTLLDTGDLEYDPNDYARLLEPIVSGQADIVYGSRFLGQRISMAWKNRIANRILTVAANLLYRAQLTDEATAYKAFRASVLRGIRLECRRFEFCPEVTAKLRRLGYRIHEVPVSYNARGIAEGKKIRSRDGWEALWTLLRHRF